jgi:hypothetical protein
MRKKAPGFSVLRYHHLGVSKQNGSSVCGGLEPFSLASVNDQGWTSQD